MIFMLEVDGVLRQCIVHSKEMANALHALNYCRALAKKGSRSYEAITASMEELSKDIVASGFFEVCHA